MILIMTIKNFVVKDLQSIRNLNKILTPSFLKISQIQIKLVA